MFITGLNVGLEEASMYDAPIYIWILALIPVVGIPGITSVMLYRGALAAGLKRRTASTVLAVAAAVFAAWIVTTGLLGAAGFYHQPSGQAAPWFGATFAVALLALLAATRIPTVARILTGPGSFVRLTVPHTLRVLGVTFLLVMAAGQLPAVFALPAGLGDIAVGLAAPFVALRLMRGTGRRRAVWFNVLGIVDLVVALTIGFLAGLGPWQVIDVTPTTEALALLPLVLIPTVAVPVAISLHIVSLIKLRADGLDTRQGPGQIAAARQQSTMSDVLSN